MTTSFQERETALAPRAKRTFGKLLLWAVVGLALLYAAWITFDLFTHPFDAGANSTFGAPSLFRWLSFSSGLLTLTIALFIVRRVAGNPVGPLLILWGVGCLGWSLRTTTGQAGWAQTLFVAYFLGLTSPALVLLLYYFPTGTTYPRWLNRWVPVFAIAMGVSGLTVVIPGLEAGSFVYGGTFIVLGVGALVSLTLRYRRGSSQERLQLRWFLWLLVMVIVLLAGGLAGGWLNAQGANLVKVVLFITWQSFAGVAIGIALLRYRLWDIDLVIRRTLLYTIVSAALLLIYLGSVVALESAFRFVTGNDQPQFVTVLSTLLIAALFVPLRRRVQAAIDRRFYRRKYDAARTLAAFGSALRDEVELAALSDSLLAVVDETMQPQTVGLWLAPAHKAGTPAA